MTIIMVPAMMIAKTVFPFLISAFVLLVPVTGSAQTGSCLADTAVQQAVASGQILPLNEILARAGLPRGTKVLPPVRVCDTSGQLFYQISVLEADGNARTLVLHASTGQP